MHIANIMELNPDRIRSKQSEKDEEERANHLGDGDDEVAELGVNGGLALEAAGDGLGQRPEGKGPQLRHRQRHSPGIDPKYRAGEGRKRRRRLFGFAWLNAEH
jgi:hypothetical protein